MKSMPGVLGWLPLPSHLIASDRGSAESGIGGKLIRAGLDACRNVGVDYVVVLGEPDYYQRFGFVTASRFGLRNGYGVDLEFMVMELSKDGCSNISGLVQYSKEFSAFS